MNSHKSSRYSDYATGLEDIIFESRQGKKVIFSKSCSQPMGPTQPPIQRVPVFFHRPAQPTTGAHLASHSKGTRFLSSSSPAHHWGPPSLPFNGYPCTFIVQSSPPLGPTQPPIQWVPVYFPGGKT